MGGMKKIIKFIGIILIIFGLLANPFVIEQFFSPDKNLDFLWKYITIIILNCILIISGLLFFYKYYLINRLMVESKINFLVCVCSIIIILLIFEFFLRFCIFSPICNIPGFNRPEYFAKEYSTEDYWILYQTMWDKNNAENFITKQYHPLLGWDQKPNLRNCFKTNEEGIIVSETQFDNSTIKILFYGDSYTESLCLNDSLPAQLENHVYLDTLNFGVGGYAFDQIFLKFNSTYQEFNNSIILIGLLFDDLDRSVQKRGCLKPYFELTEDNKLVLKGVPVDMENVEYWKTKKLGIKSYLFNWVYNSKFCQIMFDGLFLEERTKELEKQYTELKKINKAIFEEITRIRNEDNLRLYFVLYYTEDELKIDNWRHNFTKEILEENDIYYFDTRNYLINYSLKNNVSIDYFYKHVRMDNHPNWFGNKIMAEGIAQELKSLKNE